MTGAALVIARPDGQKDPAYLKTVIEQSRVTTLHFVPSMLAVFLESLPAGACRSIRQIVTSGEALSGAVQEHTFSRLPQTRLWNLYGPTEAAIDVSVWPCDPAEANQTPPIGYPIWNTALHILDATLEPLPHGVAGELYIAGISLARGYLGRSGLTAERFIACPFDLPGQRMYRTGDLARRRPDGAIEYLGRLDDQVKIRGYRIELGEIEAALLTHDLNLAQVAVIPRTIQKDQRLVAYLVARNGCTTLSVPELRTALMTTLPEYMVPTYFVNIDALPLSVNGKLDRRALPDPIIQTEEHSYRAPGNTVEILLCKLFADITGAPRVGLDDGFFALGGDSISAIRLVSRVKAEGYAMTVRDVFKHQSPASLAEVLRDLSTTQSEAWPDEGELPALPIYLEYLSANQSIDRFNQTICLQAPERLSHASVTRALELLVKHHGALRLRTEGVGVETKFIIDSAQTSPTPKIEILDLTTQESGRVEQSIHSAINALSAELNPRRPGGMIQALWVMRANRPSLLVLTLHHFVVDGVSWRILFDDLKMLSEDLSATLPQPTMSLLAWSKGLAEAGQSGQRRNEESLWLSQFKNTFLLSQDQALGEGKNTQAQVRSVSGRLSAGQTNELVRAQSIYRSEINELLLAAFGLALRQWSAQQYDADLGDLVITLEGHGRETDVDLTRTVGWLTSMFPVRLEVGDLDVSDLNCVGHALRRIKDRLRMMPDKGLGYGILCHLDSASQLAQADLARPQVIFNFLGRLDKKLEHTDAWQLLDDYASTAADDPDRQRLHLLEINAVINQTGAFNFELQFCQLVWTSQSMEALARCFENTLLKVIEHCLHSPFANRFTPSDFPLVFTQSDNAATLHQSALDRFVETCRDLQDIVPLTPTQLGLAFESLKRADSADDPNQIQIALVLEGAIDIEAMLRSWSHLVKRHDILRLTLATIDGSPSFGVIHNHPFIDAKLVELFGDDQQRVEQIRSTDLQEGFDLEQGPLLRLRLGHLNDRKHVMLISQHHLILDGWSLQILMHELAHLYDTDVKNLSGGLARTIPWREHLQWLSQQDTIAARHYWKTHLNELTEPSRLQFSQPVSNTAVTEEIHCTLDAELYEQLNSFGRNHGLTQATVLLGLYALTLGKLSRLNNIVVGNVNNGRSRSVNGMDRAIGLFINTLPLFIDLPADQSLQQWLAGVQIAQSEQDQHSHIGLAEIQNIAGFSGTSVFDALFVFENFPTNSSTIALGGLTVVDNLGHDGTTYPLALGVFPGDPLRLRLSYDRSRFDRATVQQMMDRMLLLARSIQHLGNTPLGAIRLTDDSERAALISASTHPALGRSGNSRDLVHMFEHTAATHAEQSAVVYREQAKVAHISYSELNAKANQIARYLLTLGLGSGEIVALLLPRSQELIVSILAILKTGAAYLPLDPDYPASRLEFILKDSKAKRVVSTSSIYDDLSLSADSELPDLLDFEEPLVELQISTQSDANLTDADRPVRLLPLSLAYVIYTSGSTGQPKGVGISHAAATNLVLAQQEIFKLTQADRVLQFASQAFDASVWEMLLAFGAGAALAIPNSSRADSASALLDNLQSFDITHATLPPALVAVLETSELGALRTLVVAGEACSPEIVSRFARDRHMFNAYGPTENTVCATISLALDPSKDGAIGSGPVSIGYPLVNMQAYLLDSSLEPVAPGMLGELYLAGAGLARGYIGRAALTAERFIACPFGPAGQRMYRSGDVARRREDGSIEFWGRVDEQIKIHGYRIELGEIESVLLTTSEAIKQVAVVTRDFDGDQRLVAYCVVKEEDTELDFDSLRQELSEQLPDYMVPRYFVALPALPFTPNGKLDKRALPAPTDPKKASEYAAPGTPDEQALCEIFSLLTNQEAVGVNDSFFSLGGDSISVIRLVTLARAKGLVFSVTDVFEQQTPKVLAASAHKLGDTQVITRVSEDGPLPALPVFKHFWKLAGSFKQFNQAVLLCAPAQVTLATARSALEKLRACHGALRIRCIDEGATKQLIIDPVTDMPELLVYELDLTGLDPVLAREKLTSRFLSLSDHLAPDQVGAAMVALWITLHDGSHQLALVIHHYAVDGVSWRVIIDDLNSLVQPGAKELETASVSLRTWAELLALEGSQGARRGEVPFWLEQIASMQKLPVEDGFNDGLNTLGNSKHFTSDLDQQATKDLVAAAAVYHGGINDLFLVALGFALAKWTEETYHVKVEEPVIDLEGHGRELGIDLTRTVGWLTTVFPIKIRIGDLQASHPDHLGLAIQRVKESLRAVPDKGLGFGILKFFDSDNQLAALEHNASQVGFNYLGRFEQAKNTTDQWNMAENGLIGAQDSLDRERMHLIDINTAINPSGALDISISYCQAAHRESDIAGLGLLFKQLLVNISKHCLESPLVYRRTLSDFPLLHRSLAPLNDVGQETLNHLEHEYHDFEDIVPLTPLQQGLAFETMALAAGASDPYHVHLLLTFTGQFDSETMLKSWQQVVQRHQTLRLVVAPAPLPAGYGVILNGAVADYQVIRLTGDKQERLAQLKALDFAKPFDLEKGPLIRFYEADLGQDQWAVLIANHHMILDGWSLPIVTAEIAQLYQAEHSGTVANLNDPFNWRSHLRWLQEQDSEKASQYWRQYLSELTEPSRLDLPPPLNQAHGMKNLELSLSAAVTEELNAYAKDHSLTQATVLQGLYALVLARQSRLSEIVIGSIRNGRTSSLPSIHEGVGLFINTLPMFTILEPAQTLTAWLQEQQIAMAEQDSYGFVGLREIQKLIGHTGAPLFEAMFVFENYPIKKSSDTIGQIQLTDAQTEDGNHYPVGLSVLLGDTLTLRLGFDQSRLHQDSATKLLEQLGDLIAQLRQIKGMALAEIPLLSARQRMEQIKASVGLVREDHKKHPSILPLIEALVLAAPQSIALNYEIDTERRGMTYAELDQRANQFARYLIAQGLGPDDIVGILLTRTPELIVSMLGTLRAGVAYLPLDSDYPIERLVFMLQDSGSKLVISNRAITARFVSASTRDIPSIVDVDDPSTKQQLSAFSTQRLTSDELVTPLLPEHLAYLIYTSGSTGRPKGVALSHYGMMNYLTWAMDSYEVGRGSGAPINTSIAFDATITSLWLPLIAGRTIQFVSQQNEIEALANTLQEQRQFSLVKLTPAHLEALRHLLPETTLSNQTNAYVIGGEQLTAATVAFWRQFSPNTRLINEYGPTETVVGCCVYEVSANTSQDGVIPIGKPIWNTQLYLLDPNLEPVADGSVGELYIAGDSLARGYLGRTGLTSERFIACPFGLSGSRMYRTGDLARRRQDGVFVYLGRADDQVKIRGYRIELGEIETALLKYVENLAHAVVIAKTIGTDLRLVAYLVPIQNMQCPEPAQIRTVLSQHLPEHMVPGLFVTIAELPLTPNGKLDRAKLPLPSAAPREQSVDAPKTANEIIFCNLFSTLLSTPDVGVNESFFNLGGDSILSIRLVSSSRAAGLVISVKDIFELQTPAQLALKARLASDVPTQYAWPEEGSFSGLPIYQDFLNAGGSIKKFNQTVCLQVPEHLTVVQVQGSLHELIKHHPALRLRLVDADSAKSFVINPIALASKPQIEVVDMRDLSDDASKQKLTALIQHLSNELDPEKGDLLVARWVLRKGQQALLVLTIHHFAVDGVSWRILVEDLDTVTRHGSAKLASKTMSLLSWSQHLQTQAIQGKRRAEEPFWLKQLADLRQLPQDYPAAPELNTLANINFVTGKIDRKATENVLKAPHIYFGGINDVLLAALGLALCRWSQSVYDYPLGDPVITLEGHGREGDADLSRSVGWFTTAFPVRLPIAQYALGQSSDNHNRAVRTVKECLRSIPDKGLGYGLLRRFDPESHLARTASSQPQILFNYLGRFDASAHAKNTWSLTADAMTSAADDSDRSRLQLLDINAIVDETNSFKFNITYCAKSYKQRSIETLARLFEDALSCVAQDCLDSPLDIRQTPHDFSLMARRQADQASLINQEQLDTILRRFPTAQDIIPLTAMQQGLTYESLLLDRHVTDDPYHVQLLLTLQGEIDLTALQSAWTTLSNRYTILRLVLAPAGIASGIGVILSVTDFSIKINAFTGSPAERKDSLLRYDLASPFDFETGPLIRLSLCPLDDHSNALLISNHHLILDGWSSAQLGSELAQLYAAERSGQHLTLDEPFKWQDHLKWIASSDKNQAKIYWKNYLAELTGPVHFDFPKPLASKVGMSELHITLDQALSASVKQFARDQMITQATAFQGLFALLLGRLFGMNEVIIGTVRHGRSSLLPGIDRAVGLFINTLPVFVKLLPEQNIGDWLRAQQQEAIAQEAYEYLTLSEIQPLTEVASAAMFEALFVYENYPSNGATESVGGLEVTQAQNKDGTHYPIALSVVPGESILLRLGFDTAKIDQQFAIDFLKRLEQLIQTLSNIGDVPLANLSSVSDAEYSELIERSKGETIVTETSSLVIADLLNQQANIHANSPALLSIINGQQRTLTYAELDAKSNQFARYLIARNVGPETIVAIILERSQDMIIAILGTLKAGAAYLPMDLSQPATRLRFMLSDSQAKLLVSNHNTLAKIFKADLVKELPVIDLSSPLNSNEIGKLSTAQITDSDRCAALDGNDLAYVIYTSGSTGLPKGVGFLQKSLTNLILWQQAAHPKLPQTVLQYSSIGFDVSAQEILATLTRGALLVLIDEETRKDNLSILEYVGQNDIELLHVPYVVLNNLALSNSQRALSSWPKVLITAGEQLQITPEIRRIYQQQAGYALHNHYGPTETHVVSHYVLSDDPEHWEEFPPIGKPIWNTQLLILDSLLKLVPEGIVGELYIAGDCLARGYINRSGLTAERFVANPFGLPGSRMYRSGDLVRRKLDGQIEYIGRSDDQVKIRGYRIEVGEVEAALLKYVPAIQQAAVLVRSLNGEKRLVAYTVVAQNQELPNLIALRNLLETFLPDYLIPSYFVRIETLPLTANGKLDRRALPDPDISGLQSQYVPPRSMREVYLCKLFAELTNIETVGIDDDFYQLGGHSLLAMQLVSRLRLDLKITFNLQALFGNPTPRLLATAVSDSKYLSYDPLLPIRTTGGQRPVFCIHPGGGSGSVYKNLADALPSEVPVWALQARGLEDHEAPHSSVVEMATAYIQAIRTIQAHGPYQLLGWSFGGTIAQEMAVQLERAGQNVGLLVLIDTAASSALLTGIEFDETVRTIQILEEFAVSMGLQDEVIAIDNEPFMLKLIQKMSTQGLVPENTPPDIFRKTALHMIRASQLTAAHVTVACAADIVFVRAAQEPAPDDPAVFNWAPHCLGRISNLSVDSSHSAIWTQGPSREIAAIIAPKLSTEQKQ